MLKVIGDLRNEADYSASAKVGWGDDSVGIVLAQLEPSSPTPS